MDDSNICEHCKHEADELFEHDGERMCAECKNDDLIREQRESEFFGAFHK